MNKTWWIAAISGILALIAVYVVTALLLVKLLSGMDNPGHLPWSRYPRVGSRVDILYTAFKIAVLVAVLAGLAGVRRGRESQLRGTCGIS